MMWLHNQTIRKNKISTLLMRGPAFEIATRIETLYGTETCLNRVVLFERLEFGDTAEASESVRVSPAYYEVIVKCGSAIIRIDVWGRGHNLRYGVMSIEESPWEVLTISQLDDVQGVLEEVDRIVMSNPGFTRLRRTKKARTLLLTR